MARRKRSFNTFNLSFLDVMSCGFGAVVLVYLIMNHAIEDESLKLNENLLSEVDMLEVQMTEGQAGLVQLRNTLADVDMKIADAQGRASRIAQERDEWEARIAAIRADGYAQNDDIEALKAQLNVLETELEQLRAASESNSGQSARRFIGDGNRQYLTGLNLGGRHIAILVDTSSSMLAEKLVQIIRLRNMDESVQRNAQKWVRTLNTVDWITSQLPVAAKYQLLAFNTQASYALEETRGKWLEVANRSQLDSAVNSLRKRIPAGGTSLENAFLALQDLSPPPDNIFLLTDGLPTQGTSPPKSSKVSGSDRVKLYREAVKRLPTNVPVNIILAPMEGDPMAASEFWQLATLSRGSLLSPSRDWP
ncbi:MAG: VWA domain-containing protein [Gammaproteobacteria bacterium]|nr:VWA domain-containing protein [Gammaproteobacteria bacterium]